MANRHYHCFSTAQLFTVAILIGITSSMLTVINSKITAFLFLPIVVIDESNKCVNVENYSNGDAYQCEDVDAVLRNYRVRNHDNQVRHLPVLQMPTPQESPAGQHTEQD